MDIPIIIGTVFDEAILFIHEAFDKPVDEFSYVIFASIIFGDRAKTVLERYPGMKVGDNRERLVTVGNHFVFDCSTRNATHSLLSHTHAPNNIYSYVFNHTMSFGPDSWGKYTDCYDKSCHGGELPFLWNSAQWLHDYTPEEKALAESMGQYFTNFAATGDPNKSPKHTSVSFSSRDRDCNGRRHGNRHHTGDMEELERIQRMVGLSSPSAEEVNGGNLSIHHRYGSQHNRNGHHAHRGMNLPVWEPYAANSGTMILNAKYPFMWDKYQQETCRFWDTIGYILP